MPFLDLLQHENAEGQVKEILKVSKFDTQLAGFERLHYKPYFDLRHLLISLGRIESHHIILVGLILKKGAELGKGMKGDDLSSFQEVSLSLMDPIVKGVLMVEELVLLAGDKVQNIVIEIPKPFQADNIADGELAIDKRDVSTQVIYQFASHIRIVIAFLNYPHVVVESLPFLQRLQQYSRVCILLIFFKRLLQ